MTLISNLTAEELRVCRAFVGQASDNLFKKDPSASQKMEDLMFKIDDATSLYNCSIDLSEEEAKLIELSYDVVMREIWAVEFHTLFAFEKQEALDLKESIYHKIGIVENIEEKKKLLEHEKSLMSEEELKKFNYYEIIRDSECFKELKGLGRAYWSDNHQAYVIDNRNDPNNYEIFKPKEGKQFFLNLK